MPPPREPIYNIFQPGLIRGSEKLPFDPEKAYAYVEHPTEGWRVFLRSCAFVHADGPFFKEKENFIVVKKTGSPSNGKSWEPPKGQMEGKDLGPKGPIMNYLRENVRREMEEEAAIHNTKSITYTGLVYQGRERDYPSNWFFQYHIFEVLISLNELRKMMEHFNWIKEHPTAFAKFKRDRREKDAIEFYNSERTKLYGSWSPGIVSLYLQNHSS